MLQTEFEFTLPKGYVDQDGNLHRTGIMRLANAKDEIAPLQDPRVQRNSAYLVIILLSRVISKLGTLPNVNTAVIEGLFAADLSYLQTLYRRFNENGSGMTEVSCQHCGKAFDLDQGSIFGGDHLGE